MIHRHIGLLAAVAFLFTPIVAQARSTGPPARELDVPGGGRLLCDARGAVLAREGQPDEPLVQGTCQGLFALNDRVFVAVPGRLEVIALQDPPAARPDEGLDVTGRVVGVFAGGGSVWAEIERREAVRLGTGGAPAVETGPTTTAPTATAAPLAEGQVLATGGGYAEVSLGRAQGLDHGNRIRIARATETELRLPDGTTETVTGQEQVAIADVDLVGEQVSRIKLGPNERVRVGDTVHMTTGHATASAMFPPRAPGSFEVSFAARPYITLNHYGAGLVSDAKIGYVANGPWHAQLILEPLSGAFSRTDKTDVEALGTVAFLAYDTVFFEAGLGLGYSTVSTSSSIYEAAAREKDPNTPPEDQTGLATSATAVGQLVRLGARDGLSVWLRNTFVLYEGKFRYGSTVGELLVPLKTSRNQAIARVGGGQSGWFSAEGGLRRAIRGNGDHGSLFLSATAGYGMVFGGTADPVTLGGPMVGVGVEWRP